MRKGVCTALRSDLFGVVWKVSLPIIFLAGTETLDHLINTAFMAHLGVDELGAIAVADSVLLLFLVPLRLYHSLSRKVPTRALIPM